MDKLQTYLRRTFGIGVDDLSEAEKASYREWGEILKGRKLTDKDVSEFLEQMRSKCTLKLRKLSDLKRDEALFWSMQLDLVENIQGFLFAPSMEKKMMEDHIDSLANSG